MADPHAGGPLETVVMVTTSYPRFPGDAVGTFMEPIAKGIAARGHRVHVVLPWHPDLRREGPEGGVWFHPFRYAPHASLNVFGYARGLQADVRLKRAAYLVAPLALAAAWRTARRVAQEQSASVLHGHWVIPGGVIASRTAKLPLLISLHGSDVFVAEQHLAARLAARSAFRRAGWVTACSDDLRRRAVRLGAAENRSETIPYGVDTARFAPDPAARRRRRQALGLDEADHLVFSAGRLVRKKGFEYLIDAVAALETPRTILVLGGGGDLEAELRRRARERGAADRVRFAGVLEQGAVAEFLAAADVAIVPSVRDAAGNVDGLPNVVMEALASSTPLVTTDAGGIPAVAIDDRTAVVVPQADAPALGRAIDGLLRQPERAKRIGGEARAMAVANWSWERVAARFEMAYANARRV